MSQAALHRLPLVGTPAPPARLGVVASSSGVRVCGEGEPTAAEALLQVGDLARAAQKTVRAIHHYEELGLLAPSARSKGRFRLYEATAVARVRWIGKLHDLGMSLAEIRTVLTGWEASPSAPGAMAKVRDIFAEKLEETRAQVIRLQALERELEASLAYLGTCDRCDPAELVAACSACQVREAGDLAPELVAGLSLASAGCSCSKSATAFPQSLAAQVPPPPADQATTRPQP